MDRSKLLRIHECKMSKNGEIVLPIDEFSERVLVNLKASCDEYDKEEAFSEIPQQPASLLPFHNLYLAFYSAAYGVAMLLQYGITYTITGEEKYGFKAKSWLLASIQWDVSAFSFYSSARLMHAIIAAIQWIQDLMSDNEIEQVYLYLKKLCLNHEKQAIEMCTGKETGGHANLYTAGFGLASLALASAGMEPKAGDWLRMVITKYERNLLPEDGDKDGTYQPDGNWSIEYAFRYKFIFLDALRLVTGRDLVSEHYEDVIRPVRYLKYAYMGDGKVPVKDFYDSNENMLEGYQINTFGALYLRFASLTKDPYLQWIGMSNPVPGRLHAYGIKVKGGHRFIYSVGFSDYLWYDPSVKPEFAPPEDKAKLFSDGEIAILRTGYGRGLTLAYQGRRGNVMYMSPDLMLNKNGSPMFCTAPTRDSLPLAEANGPAAGGGEMERKGVIQKLIHLNDNDALKIDGFLTRQKISVSCGLDEAINIEVSRRKRTEREVSLQRDTEGKYLRLRGEGYLQYSSQKNFNPNQGVIQIEFRLSKEPSRSNDHPAVLFSIGQHLKYMFGNAIFIGFLEEGRLGVKFKDNEGRWLFAHFSRELPAIQPYFWHSITVYWRDLNKSGADPVCGIIYDGYHAEARLTMPGNKAFQCIPNTGMWVGAAVQMPDSFADTDFRKIKIYGRCPRYKNGIVPRESDLLFEADYGKGVDAVFSKGKGAEIAEKGLEYRLHVREDGKKQVVRHKDCIQIINGDESVYISGKDIRMSTESLPPLRAGFAGASFEEESNRPLYRRIVIRPCKNKSKLHFKITSKKPD